MQDKLKSNFSLVIFIAGFLGQAVVAHATDYANCNDFLSKNDFSRFVKFNSDGTPDVTDDFKSKILHNTKVYAQDGKTITHIEILVSRKKNKDPHPSEFTDDIVNVYLDDQGRPLLIERSGNTTGISWNGVDYKFRYDNPKGQCAVAEEGSFTYLIDPKAKVPKQHSTIYNTENCASLMDLVQTHPEIDACLRNSAPGTANCLKNGFEKGVQQMMDHTVGQEALAIPAMFPKLSDRVRFLMMTCQWNDRAKLATETYLKAANKSPAIGTVPASNLYFGPVGR